MFAGFGLLADLRNGVIERCRVTPVSRVALLLGRALRDVVVMLIQAAIVTILALPFGLRIALVELVLAYVFLPKGFDLLIGFNPEPERVANIIGLNDYLSFVIRMFLVFGIAFVMPVFLVGLNLAGIVSGRQLLRAWRPVILGSFVFAAVATPSGDPWTMSALALPMLVLYYIAAGLSLLTDRRRRNQRIDGVDYSHLDDEEASPLHYTSQPLDEPDDVDPPSDGIDEDDDPDRR